MSFAETLAKHPVIFLGAGMSASLGYPTATELAIDLTSHLPEAGAETEGLDQIVEKLKERYKRKDTIRIIQEYFKRREVPFTQNPYSILKLILDKIGGEFTLATTNWDLEADKVFGEDVVVRSPEDYVRVQGRKTIVVKLHGDFHGPIILSPKEAEEHKGEREKIYLQVFGSSVSKPVVLLGYGAGDPDFVEWAKKVKDSVEFALVLLEKDAKFPAKELVTGKDVVEFLRDEAVKLGIELPETLTPLSIYDEIVKTANAAAAKRKSLVCFAPRISGKTTAYESTRPRVTNLFPECHDIGPSGYHKEELLEIIEKVPRGGVFMTASPYAVEWAAHERGVKSLECEVLPVTISEAEAESILWNCSESKVIPSRVLKANNAELVKTILEHSKTKFSMFGTTGTTFRPALIRAHLQHFAREWGTWAKSDEEFIEHAKKELGDRSKIIEEYVGASALVSADAAAILVGPLATAASLFVPAIAIAAVTAPVLHRIIGRLTGKESKAGELADLAELWGKMEPAEREVFAEKIDEKRKYPPGTSYANLARIFGEKDYLVQLTKTFDDWFNTNKLEVMENIVTVLKVDKDFRALVEDIALERWDVLARQLEAEIVQLKTKVQELEKNTEESRGIYRHPEGLGIRKKDFEYFFGTDEEHMLVRGEKYDLLADRIIRLLEEGKRVALTGRHGLGKSLLARYALGKGLTNGVLAVHEVDREKVKKAMIDGANANLILFYDPSGPEAYFPRASAGTAFEKLRTSIKEIIEDIVDTETPSLVVLPNDIWESEGVGEDLRNKFEQIDPSAELSGHDFLLNIIAEYAESSNLEGDIEGLLEHVEGGGPLVAAYAGMWLKQNGLRISNVSDALSEAKGSPILFLQSFVQQVVLKDDWYRCLSFAFPLIVHTEFGEISSELAQKLPLAFKELNLGPLEPFAAGWISKIHEDLMEEALRKFVEEAESSSTNLSKAILEILEQLDKFSKVAKRDQSEKREVSGRLISEFIRDWMRPSELDSEDLPVVLELYARSMLGQTYVGPTMPKGPYIGPAISDGSLFDSSSPDIRTFFFSNRQYQITELARSLLLGEWTRGETAASGILQYLKFDSMSVCEQLKAELGEFDSEGKQVVARPLMWASAIAYAESEYPAECLCRSMDTVTVTLDALRGTSPESERVHRGIGIRLANKLRPNQPEQARSLSRYLLEVSWSGIWEDGIYSSDFIHLRSLAEKSTDWISWQNVLEALLNCYTMTEEGDLRAEIINQILDLSRRVYLEKSEFGSEFWSIRRLLLLATVGVPLVRFYRAEASRLQMLGSVLSDENLKEAAKGYQKMEAWLAETVPLVHRRLEETTTQTPDQRRNEDLLNWMRSQFPLAPDEDLEQNYPRWLRHLKLGILSFQASSIEVRTENDALRQKSLFEELAKTLEEFGEGKTENAILARQIALLAGYMAGDKTSVPTISPLELQSIEASGSPRREYLFSPEFYGWATACHLMFLDPPDVTEFTKILTRFWRPLHRLRLISALTYGIFCLKLFYKTGTKEGLALRMFEVWTGIFAYHWTYLQYKPCLQVLLYEYLHSLPDGTTFHVESFLPLSYEEAVEECIRINLPEAAKLKTQSEGRVWLFADADGRIFYRSGDNEFIPLDMGKISECWEALESHKKGRLKEYLLENLRFGHPEHVRELFESLDDRLALMAVALIQSEAGCLLLIIQFLLDGRPELVIKLCNYLEAVQVSMGRSKDLRDDLLKRLGEAAKNEKRGQILDGLPGVVHWAEEEAAKNEKRDQILDYLMRLFCAYMVVPVL